jgi:hypothetical protein
MDCLDTSFDDIHSDFIGTEPHDWTFLPERFGDSVDLPVPETIPEHPKCNEWNRGVSAGDSV